MRAKASHFSIYLARNIYIVTSYRPSFLILIATSRRWRTSSFFLHRDARSRCVILRDPHSAFALHSFRSRDQVKSVSMTPLTICRHLDRWNWWSAMQDNDLRLETEVGGRAERVEL